MKWKRSKKVKEEGERRTSSSSSGLQSGNAKMAAGEIAKQTPASESAPNRANSGGRRLDNALKLPKDVKSMQVAVDTSKENVALQQQLVRPTAASLVRCCGAAGGAFESHQL